MKRFVVAYINFFDNELIQEMIEAESEHEARWKHSKLQSQNQNDCIRDTASMDNMEFQSWCFDFEMLVSVMEIA